MNIYNFQQIDTHWCHTYEYLKYLYIGNMTYSFFISCVQLLPKLKIRLGKKSLVVLSSFEKNFIEMEIILVFSHSAGF
jgi:hypothetical protein